MGISAEGGQPVKRRYKVAAVDYKENMLPQTRKEVFVDVLRLHGFDFLKLGLCMLLLFIPSVSVTLTVDLVTAQYMAQAQQTAQKERQELLAAAAEFQSSMALWQIPLLMLFSVALSGAVRLIRQFAHEQIPFFWRDLGLGIRQNGAQMAALAAIVGIQQAVGMYLYVAGNITADSAIELACAVYWGISAVAFFPIWAYMVVLIGLYNNSFRQNLRVAAAVYARTIGSTILTLVAVVSVLLVGLIPNMICHLAGRVLGMLLLPVSLLIWTLFVYEQLDRYINPHFFPELVGRGLYRTSLPEDNTEQLKGDTAR